MGAGYHLDRVELHKAKLPDDPDEVELARRRWGKPMCVEPKPSCLPVRDLQHGAKLEHIGNGRKQKGAPEGRRFAVGGVVERWWVSERIVRSEPKADICSSGLSVSVFVYTGTIASLTNTTSIALWTGLNTG